MCVAGGIHFGVCLRSRIFFAADFWSCDFFLLVFLAIVCVFRMLCFEFIAAFRVLVDCVLLCGCFFWLSWFLCLLDWVCLC